MEWKLFQFGFSLVLCCYLPDGRILVLSTVNRIYQDPDGTQPHFFSGNPSDGHIFKVGPVFSRRTRIENDLIDFKGP